MSVLELFSKRQKKLKGESPDVFIYDQIPTKLRVQIIHIIRDAIGKDQYNSEYARNVYEFIHQALCREYGLFTLKEYSHSDEEAVLDFFLKCTNTDQVLDVVEMSFRIIDGHIRDSSYQYHATTKISPDDAILELNTRFKENGVGFQFESGEVMRIDSKYLHSEAVKPTLTLLRQKTYKGANEEFLKAHEHYRHGRNKESLNECLKSFESVMKAICEKRKWKYDPKDTAKKLIETCLANELIPNYLQNQFMSLRLLLESGIPTVRNKLGGHGQGAEKITVEDDMVGYALHLTATNILFLVDAEKRKP